MRWLLMVGICVFFTPCFAAKPRPDTGCEETREEVIEQQIKVLEDRKNRYKASARRHQDNVDRWQFDSRRIDETRLERKYVEIDQITIQDIELKIEDLKRERHGLLNGE